MGETEFIIFFNCRKRNNLKLNNNVLSLKFPQPPTMFSYTPLSCFSLTSPLWGSISSSLFFVLTPGFLFISKARIFNKLIGCLRCILLLITTSGSHIPSWMIYQLFSHAKVVLSLSGILSCLFLFFFTFMYLLFARD